MEASCSRAMPYLKAVVPDDSSGEPLADISDADAPVFRPYCHGLAIAYLVDQGIYFEYIAQRHLRDEGLTEETLHHIAMGNLVNYASEHARVHAVGNAFALLLDGNLEASLLLVDGLWEEALTGYAPSGLMVAVPARDVLAFADAESSKGVRELRKIVARTFKGGDHLLTRDLLMRESHSWVVSA